MIPVIVPEVQAVILAGGKSERMGSPKALLDFRGNTFIAHLLLALQPQVNGLVIMGQPAGVSLADLGVEIIKDSEQDGPLAAIAQALAASRKAWVLFAPCDNPLLPPNYAQQMLYSARHQQTKLVYVEKHDRAQPLYALIHKDLLPSLQAYLAAGGRKIMDWYREVEAGAVEWTDAGLLFENINTPEEYQAFVARDRGE